MARGKYLSLEEARKSGKLAQFAREHPNVADADMFDALKDAMLKPASMAAAPPRPAKKRPRNRPEGGGTSTRGKTED